MRVSLAGGGTDLPAYYRRHGGMVVSATIDKYVYVTLTPNGLSSLQISSADYSTFVRCEADDSGLDAAELRYARTLLRVFGVRAGLAVFTASEVPPGNGLGSSSALTVALTRALSALQDGHIDGSVIAELAAQTEIEQLGMPIGKQDHYAASLGGLNAFHFSQSGVEVEPLVIEEHTRRRLSEWLLLYWTGQSHNSARILAEQSWRSGADTATVASLHRIKGHAEEVRRALLDGRIEALGEILHRTWMDKKRLARGISTLAIDAAYEAARAAGATGGKITGAGGGGFLMIVCPPERCTEVDQALGLHGLRRLDFHLESEGTRVLVDDGFSRSGAAVGSH